MTTAFRNHLSSPFQYLSIKVVLSCLFLNLLWTTGFAQKASLYQQAKASFDQKDYIACIQLAKQGVGEKKPLKNPDSLDIALNLLIARSYQQQDRLFLAFEHFLFANHQASRYSGDFPTYQITLEIGDMFSDRQVYDKALEYYKEALVKASGKGYPQLYMRIGECFFQHREFDSCLVYLEQASIHPDIPEETRAHCQIRIAEILAKQQKIQEAIKRLSLSESSLPDHQKITVKNYLGYLYGQRNEFDEAHKHYIASLALCRKWNLFREEALVHSRIAVLWDQQGKTRNALKALEKAVEIQRQHELKTDLATTYNYVAKVLLSQSQFNDAVTYADSALLVLGQKTPLPIQENAYKVLVKSYELKGSTKKQRHYEKLLRQVIAEMQNNAKKLERKSTETSEEIASFEQQYREIISRQSLNELELQNIQLSNESHRKQLELITKEAELKEQQLLFAHENLANQQQASTIQKLEEEKKINALKLEQERLQNLDKEQKITLLERENHLKQLDLKLKEQALKNQQYFEQLVIAGSFILFLIGAITWLFLRQKQRQKLLRFEQEKIQTENKLFRAQMNPHFLFNSLNSIKSFILQNDIRPASSYLSKFAMLMRHILNNSDQAFIPLSKEIETLKLYLELEKLRFEDKFDFEIEVDDFIEPENTYIPPMLLQPHIENAILHGVRHKEDVKGWIKVEIVEETNHLFCVIEDNGIGRKKSRELKHGEKKHESKASSLLQKHLKNLHRQEDEAIHYEIVDLIDEQGNAVGTRVEYRLPIKSEVGVS